MAPKPTAEYFRQHPPSKLKTLLPQALLHDNIALNHQLKKTVNGICENEEKMTRQWRQIQKYFIKQQAYKADTQGMTLFPYFQNPKSHRSYSLKEREAYHLPELHKSPRIPPKFECARPETTRIDASTNNNIQLDGPSMSKSASYQSVITIKKRTVDADEMEENDKMKLKLYAVSVARFETPKALRVNYTDTLLFLRKVGESKSTPVNDSRFSALESSLQ